ncbi:PKD domain-containing protein [Halobaculum lipolyticum]|uniref:PKD domain-containing protein n=1 Tax=Halobaculum lipolyticum TaxID=3032001 RepID=A0ABD5W6C0_9EURY|nr:PKD domain-containing protein [Halobaculum sp. DT31]
MTRRRSLALALLLLLAAGAVPAGAHPEENNDPPLVDAGLDRRVDRGATVWLDGGGSVDPDGELVAYGWSIRTPAGETVGPRDPDAESTSFTADEVGRYEVTLTATDDHGATRSDTLFVEVSASSSSGGSAESPTGNGSTSSANEPPTGSILGPDTVVRGEPETFTADVYDPDGDVVSFAWSDGRSGRAVTRTVDLPAGESFEFSVRVTDDDGATQTFRKTVRVRDPDGGSAAAGDNTPPNVRVDGPDRVAVGADVSFVFRGSDPGGTIVSYTWSDPATGSGAVLDHRFDSPGTYTVGGVVTDDDGATTSASKTVEVYEEGPPVVEIVGPDTAPAGTTQAYTLEAYDPDGGELTIVWDPAQSRGEIATDRYVNNVGIDGLIGDTVEIRATVTDDEGNTVTAVKETDVEQSIETGLGETIPRLSGIGWRYVHDDATQTSDTDTVEIGTYEFSATVFHNEPKLVRARWTVNDSVESGYTDSLGRFNGSKSTGIRHTFVSENGGLVSRAVTVDVVDADGDTDEQKWVSRVHSVQSHDDITFYASVPGRTARGSDVLIEPGEDVVFTVGSSQNYRILFGDGTSVEGTGTSMLDDTKFPHTFDDPGTYIVRLISTQGPKGEAIETVTVTVRPRTYFEYWYETNTQKISRVVSEEKPKSGDWEKVTVQNAETVYTGRTVSVRAGSGRPAMIDEGWRLNDTTVEEQQQRVTRVRKSDPDGSGDSWTLVQRNVRSETRTYYEDKYTWYGSSFRRPGWTQTGETRTERVVIGDGHDHDRERHSRTTRSCTDWDLDPGPFGGFSRECARWDYDTDVWYTGHDHDGRTYYDTEYQYKTEVKRTETVWYHEYAGTKTRTVRIKTFAETETRVEWLWERDIGAVRQEYSLRKPQPGEYISGTVRRVEVRCGSDDSHHDEVKC